MQIFQVVVEAAHYSICDFELILQILPHRQSFETPVKVCYPEVFNFIFDVVVKEGSGPIDVQNVKESLESCIPHLIEKISSFLALTDRH